MKQTDLHAGPVLTATLSRIRARWWRVAALGAGARASMAAAVVIAMAALAERLVAPSDATVLAIAVGAVVAAAGAAAAIAWPLRRRPDNRRVARFVEERAPECADAIVTAVEVTEQGHARGDFAPLVVAAAVRKLEAIDPGAVVEPRELRSAAGRAGGALAMLVFATVLARPFLDRAAQVAYARAFPASIALSVTPGDMRVAAGRPATIVATVKGRAVTLDRLAASITLDAGGQTVTAPMERTADGYRFQIPSVDRSFRYIVSAGPATSRAYAVTALHPARVQRIDLQYDFPSFTGLKPRLERGGGDVFGPAGTRVRLLVHTDQPVREGALEFSQGQPSAPLDRIDDRTFAAALTITQEAAYRVGLVDPDGLTSESVEYFVRVMDDRPPTIHILRPGGDEGITPLQEVPIEARADDDFGIQKMDLVFSVAGGAEAAVPFTSMTGTDLARIGARMIAAEDLKVKPGDVIAYYARAWDVPRAKRSTMARSEIFFLEVKPFNEEFTLAMSQAGMQAGSDTQLDGLISAQKEIISATWNLERRSGAGTSAADVKGVADAQMELKTRAERAAGAAQPRRRLGREPRAEDLRDAAATQSPPGGADPVAQAVEAMGRAAQELQGKKTAGAIPHEMAALNALLQAQAEVRRRQVAQQQGTGGSAFGNRQSQDLSTLFDRELKRQQKTNYENQTPIETQQETPAASALDRIRDLARRQEELARQQRELAKSGLPQEETKRRLETLTREQEALRRQLEEAAQQAKAQPNGSSGAQQDMNTALQQMREAQRGDAAGAASSGQQAAEALRRAESRMEGASPDAQRRALGDLQLEAQQIANAQQRVADEADRLDREGGGTGDARRRLAADKDRLADRVDALEQSARRLPTAGETAKELAAQQLGDRMRTTAQAFRSGQTGRSSGQAEHQIAEAMDRVARTLGSSDAGGAKGETKGETTQLAGDLDELRDARERIARLERDMRDAQQRAGSQARPGQGARGDEAQSSGTPAADGRQGRSGSQAVGQGGGEVDRLQQQLNDEMRRTRELVDRVQRGTPASGGRMGTPEQHEWSRSAPGTEAFKQDYAAWQSLAAQVARALEHAESSAASRLSAALARDRLRAGGSDRVPDAYQRRVSRYFESIAVKKQP